MTAVPGEAADAVVDVEAIRRIVRGMRTVAVVGLSSNPLRGSHFVGVYLQRHGYRVVPVNPNEREVLGERAYPSLTDVPVPVDVVDVFRAPAAVPGVAREAIEIGAPTLWLQYGVVSVEGATLAREAGLQVVMDRCLKVEHARHLGRMHWLGFNTGRIVARRGGLD